MNARNGWKAAPALGVMLLVLAACQETPLLRTFKTISGTAAWGEQEELVPDGGGVADDNFGRSVAVCGNYAVVGVPLDDTHGSSKGAVYLFKRPAGASSWSRAAILYGDWATSHSWEYFGSSVDLDGQYIIVGAKGYSIDASNFFRGAVYVFKVNSDDSCTQQERVIGQANNEMLGSAVSISGDVAVAGAPGYNSGEGRAYVFERNGSDWDFSGAGGIELKKSDPAVGAAYGVAVAVSGLYIAVGAPTHSSQGKVYIYNDLDGTWGSSGYQEDDSVLAPAPASGDQFGLSLSMSVDLLAVGAPGNGGAAYLYRRSAGDYGLEQELVDPDKTNLDEYGTVVAVGANWALVGSPLADDQGTNSGAASAFFDFDGRWTRLQRLATPNAEAYETLGNSLDLDGLSAIIGAQCDAGNLDEAGSAFIYRFE